MDNKPTSFAYLRFGKDAFQKDTGKARLFQVGSKPIWIPNSQVRKDRQQGKDGLIDAFYSDGEDDVIIVVADWLVKNNGLEEHLDQEWVDAGCPQ